MLLKTNFLIYSDKKLVIQIGLNEDVSKKQDWYC